jgi:hypothetical protein
VRFRRYPAAPVNLSDLERASFLDLLPLRAQAVVRQLGGWLIAGLGVAIVAAITAAVTLLVGHAGR